jgi:DNA-binding NarL/FixJ family response regulator
MSSGSAATLRVMCVDDNDLVSTSLQRLIERDSTLSWAGFVNDPPRILECVRETKPDIVLMDIDIPGIDTFALVERMAAEMPQVRVVMFSGYVNLAYVERSLDSGAWGYLSKNEDVAQLIAGIKTAGRGEIALSREVEAARRGARSG